MRSADILVKQDSASLKLHVSDGQVWYRAGLEPHPQLSHMSALEFVESPVARSMERIRLLGMHGNAKLITLLYDMQLKGLIDRVEVASPLICPTVRSRHTPQHALYEMGLCGLGPSQGGFHKVVEDDYRTYALAVEVMAGFTDGVPISEQAVRLLRGHPAWRPLSFVASVSLGACAGLISYMLDPRWYIDQCHPNRLCRLFMSFGLNPKTQAGVSLPGKDIGRYHTRCNLVMNCWKDSSSVAKVRDMFEVTTPIPVANSEQTGITPGDFPWRIWGTRMGIGLPDTEAMPVYADLRASQRFIAFLRHTWLSELYRGSHATPEQQTSLFRAVDFFKHTVEVAAYEQHQLNTEMI